MAQKADTRFRPYARFLLTGASGSGKTEWAINLIRYRQVLFQKPPTYVKWYYRVYQDVYRTMLQSGLVQEVEEGIPSIGEVEELSKKYPNCLIVIDDPGQDRNLAVLADLFAVVARHNKVNVIVMTQNLFPRGRGARDVTLNATVLVLFRNLRDLNQISTFGRQFQPTKAKGFLDVYRDVTSDKAYSYLLLDFSQDLADNLRIRTDIFPWEYPQKVYILN